MKTEKSKAPKNSLTRTPRSVLAFMDTLIEDLLSQHRHGTADKYSSSRSSFSKFLRSCGSRDVALRRINARMLANYQEWLFSNGGCTRNTVSFYMRFLKAAYNKAVHDGLVARSSYGIHPFEAVSTAIAETRKRAIPQTVIRQLCLLDIPTALAAVAKCPERKSYARIQQEVIFARDIFLFCFCAQGMPFVDFAHLRQDNLREGYLSYERHKTGKHIEIEILPQMQAVLDKYAVRDCCSPFLFPIISIASGRKAYVQYRSALRCYNRRLKLLSQLLGLQVCLTTYVARHSWATAAYHCNIPLTCISEALGHTNETTTRRYLKSLSRSTLAQANKQLLDSVFDMPEV